MYVVKKKKKKLRNVKSLNTVYVLHGKRMVGRNRGQTENTSDFIPVPVFKTRLVEGNYIRNKKIKKKKRASCASTQLALINYTKSSRSIVELPTFDFARSRSISALAVLTAGFFLTSFLVSSSISSHFALATSISTPAARASASTHIPPRLASTCVPIAKHQSHNNI